MKLSPRSALFLLSLGLGCGPTGEAARTAEARLVDGGAVASGPSLPGATGGTQSIGATGGTLASSRVAGANGSAGGSGGHPAALGGSAGNDEGSALADGGLNEGGAGGGISAAVGGAGADTGTDGGNGGGGSAIGDAAAPADVAPPSAAELLARLGACQELTTGRYATDQGGSATVAVCGLANALYWKADMDINCNGKSSSTCNASTDSGYVPKTAGTDSKGGFLDAATLPFVVIPAPSARFDYRKHDIAPGAVVAVVYKGRVEYGVFGEVGATDIIGEASVAMAKKLGIDPDPETGGVNSGVIYVVFTGATGQASKLEDHDEAVRIGQARAAELMH